MPIRPALRALAVLAAALMAIGAHAAAVTVSAAASLGDVLRELVPIFEAAHAGARVQLNLGASGALLAQLSKGAPVDVFVSADQPSMDKAQALGLVMAARRRDLASNALVVVVPAAARHPSLRQLQDLVEPKWTRVAVGLPASVPAGRYARDAFEAAGIWPRIESKVVGAHSVRQALDYVARGEVEAGLVYATDAKVMRGKVKVALVVPTPRPIVYPVAVLTSAPQPAAATAFVDFLFGPAAQAVLARHGFGKP